MFSNFGFGEIAVLALFGLLIFGPEKLPKAAADTARMIRQLRSMATTTVNDFKTDLGPEAADLDLRSLSPRRLIEKVLLDDDPDRSDPESGPTQNRQATATPSRTNQL